jgi:hypothetical protein
MQGATAVPMLRNILILLFLSGLLAACGRGMSQVADTAENVRLSTERMADSAENASNARQARIFAQATRIERQETMQREGPRYEARKDGAGDNWTIYDNLTDKPAVVGTEVEIGLTHAQAAARLAHMIDETQITFPK